MESSNNRLPTDTIPTPSLVACTIEPDSPLFFGCMAVIILQCCQLNGSQLLFEERRCATAHPWAIPLFITLHELSVLEEILRYDHGILIGFALVRSPNVPPPPNTLQFTLNSDSFNILPLGATDAHNHTSLQEDYVGKPWVKVLWHEL